jgi:hypothetical protein
MGHFQATLLKCTSGHNSLVETAAGCLDGCNLAMHGITRESVLCGCMVRSSLAVWWQGGWLNSWLVTKFTELSEQAVHWK